MSTTRRQFLSASLASGAFASGLVACSSPNKAHAKSSQSILILGGTSFVGPALVEAALARGHRVTLFNSGRTEERRAEAGRPSAVPEGVEILIGNRDPKLTADDRRLAGDPDIEKKRDPASPRGLTQLEGKHWDAAIDTSGFFPRMVRASAELLAPEVEQYVYVSSISAYSGFEAVGQDETAKTSKLEDPEVEEFGPDFVNYGAGKAACEAAAEAAMPGRVTNVRPGYIVGPRDTSRRWLWWPWRTAQGGQMLVPGAPEDPEQIIDVRDLAEWMIHTIEMRTVGVFNATGPATKLTTRAMLADCARCTNGEALPVWVDPAFLAEHELAYPIWSSPEGELAGLHQVSIAKALAAGLRFRPTEVTARDTLAWYASLPKDLQSHLLPPITLEKEAEVLALWEKRG